MTDNLDQTWLDELTRAFDMLDTVFSKQVGDAFRAGRYHSLTVLLHLRPIHRHVTNDDPDLARTLADPSQMLGRIEERFGRDAAHVEARATQCVALDAGHAESELSGSDRRHVARRAGPDDG